MLRVIHPPTFGPERGYVLRVILSEWLGLQFVEESGNVEGLQITRIGGPESGTLEIADVLFSTPMERWLTISSLPTAIRSWKPNPILEGVPTALGVLFGHELQHGDYLTETPGRVQLGVDVFGTAFFMLTRYEEVVDRRRDEFERFSSQLSILHHSALLQRPIVNELVELLWWALRRLWPDLIRKPRAYRCLLSCDVDNVSIMGASPLRAFRRVAGSSVRDALREGPWYSMFGRAATHWSAWRGRPNADEFDDFDFLMDQADEHGCKFVFNFIAGHGASGRDGIYDVGRLGIRALMRRIHERGHELGFHGSYESFRNAGLVGSEFGRLFNIAAAEGVTQAEWGGRQHYLRWEAPTTWQAYDDAGLAYDSTLSYADLPGFRCGTCYEFPVFNLLTRRTLTLRERSLTVMEASLLKPAYMGLNIADAVKMVVALSDQCRRYGGDFSLLWHNGQTKTPVMRAAFVAMLRAATSAEMALPETVVV